jgi:hypothetical protein
MSQVADPDLRKLVIHELLNVTIDKWGYYFPLMLAMWHYIEQRHPGLLGDLRATYAEEPELMGAGADWFCGTLMSNRVILDALDAIAYGVVDRLPHDVLQRGFVTTRDLPEIDPTTVELLQSEIDIEVAKRSQ